MPLIQIDNNTWRRSFSRILWNGPPLSGKTTGSLTLPRPCHLVVAPGELGYSSVAPESDFKIWAWEWDPAGSNETAKAVLKEVQDKLTDILTRKEGEAHSLVLDGLHKFYDLMMKAEGWTRSDVDVEGKGKQYIKYHDVFRTFLSRLLQSWIPLVGATCYDGLERVDPESKTDKSTQVFPQLPGIMAKEIMGTFPVTFHTYREGGRYYWDLQAQGKMQAAGMHVPPKFIARMPKRIEVVIDAKGEVKGGWKEIEKALGTN